MRANSLKRRCHNIKNIKLYSPSIPGSKCCLVCLLSCSGPLCCRWASELPVAVLGHHLGGGPLACLPAVGGTETVCWVAGEQNTSAARELCMQPVDAFHWLRPQLGTGSWLCSTGYPLPTQNMSSLKAYKMFHSKMDTS